MIPLISPENDKKTKVQLFSGGGMGGGEGGGGGSKNLQK